MNKFDELNILKNTSNICLISHEHPDADALSSMIVFREFLIQFMNVSNVDIYADCDHISDCYLPILDNVMINKPIQNYDIAIMMDSTADDRLGQYSSIFNNAKTKIVIDHHKTNKYQGNINIIDITSSTCQIIFEICKYFNFELSTANQGKLYAGLITDTNNLTVGEMNPNTFLMIADIYNNIDTYSIYENFFSNNTVKNMQIFAKALENMKTSHNNQIVYSHITREESLQYNCEPDDYNGIINRLATISGSKLILFIYPKESDYYASMRARHGYDVSSVAQKYGGGGHKGASAFLSTGPIERTEDLILDDFISQLDTNRSKYRKFTF